MHAIAIAILSICLSVTLVVHIKTVQDIKMGFAPYDTTQCYLRILYAKFRGRTFRGPPKQMR